MMRTDAIAALVLLALVIATDAGAIPRWPLVLVAVVLGLVTMAMLATGMARR